MFLCFIQCGQAAPAATNEPSLQLNIELRDGSRVVGQGVDETLKFQSQLLGDLKLNLKALRSIVCLNTNSARLTTTNGDTLAVWFTSPALRVSTKFGRVELPVALIRQILFTPTGRTGALPSGLVALWSGEGDGNDSLGNNNAVLTDITFAEGKVGQAFVFNGASSYFSIPQTPTIDVGTSDGFTVMAWIKPTNIDGIFNLIEWNDYLCAFEIGQTPSDRGVLVASIFDSGRNNHFLRSGTGSIVANVFQHVALTYDNASGFGTLYVNGTIVARSLLGSYTPLTKWRASDWLSSQQSG